jgi:hypothetical protein
MSDYPDFWIYDKNAEFSYMQKFPEKYLNISLTIKNILAL